MNNKATRMREVNTLWEMEEFKQEEKNGAEQSHEISVICA
jgi:hypothetical protein